MRRCTTPVSVSRGGVALCSLTSMCHQLTPCSGFRPRTCYQTSWTMLYPWWYAKLPPYPPSDLPPWHYALAGSPHPRHSSRMHTPCCLPPRKPFAHRPTAVSICRLRPDVWCFYTDYTIAYVDILWLCVLSGYIWSTYSWLPSHLHLPKRISHSAAHASSWCCRLMRIFSMSS